MIEVWWLDCMYMYMLICTGHGDLAGVFEVDNSLIGIMAYNFTSRIALNTISVCSLVYFVLNLYIQHYLSTLLWVNWWLHNIVTATK